MLSRGGGGQVVSMLTFDYNALSSNPVKRLSFFCKSCEYIEKPQQVIEPEWGFSFGISASTGINPFNGQASFIIGPSITLGKRIDLKLKR